jgi:hypothetical protein
MTAPSFSRNGGLLKGKQIVTVTAERDGRWKSLPKGTPVGLPVQTVGRKSNRVSQNVTKHSEMADSDFLKVPCNRTVGPEGCRGIALLFPDFDTRRGGWSAQRPGHFTPSKDPVSLVQERGWAPGQVRSCAKYLVPNGIRSPDRPVRSRSINRLSYPSP